MSLLTERYPRQLWENALAKRQEISEEVFREAWDFELIRLTGFDFSGKRKEQIDPLFTNKWSPEDAADHLRRVWAIKGWSAQQYL